MNKDNFTLNETMKTQGEYIEANIERFLSLEDFNKLGFYFDNNTKDSFLRDIFATYDLPENLYDILENLSNIDFIEKLNEYNLINDFIYRHIDFKTLTRDIGVSSYFTDYVIETEKGLLIHNDY